MPYLPNLWICHTAFSPPATACTTHCTSLPCILTTLPACMPPCHTPSAYLLPTSLLATFVYAVLPVTTLTWTGRTLPTYGHAARTAAAFSPFRTKLQFFLPFPYTLVLPILPVFCFPKFYLPTPPVHHYSPIPFPQPLPPFTFLLPAMPHTLLIPTCTTWVPLTVFSLILLTFLLHALRLILPCPYHTLPSCIFHPQFTAFLENYVYNIMGLPSTTLLLLPLGLLPPATALFYTAPATYPP